MLAAALIVAGLTLTSIAAMAGSAADPLKVTAASPSADGVTLTITGSGFVTPEASMTFDGNEYVDTNIVPTYDMAAQADFTPAAVPLANSQAQYLFGAEPYPPNYSFLATNLSIPLGLSWGYNVASNGQLSICTIVAAPPGVSSCGNIGAAGVITTTAQVNALAIYRPSTNPPNGSSVFPALGWLRPSDGMTQYAIIGAGRPSTPLTAPATLFLGTSNDGTGTPVAGVGFQGTINGDFTIKANSPSVYGQSNGAGQNPATIFSDTLADFEPAAWTVNDKTVYGYYNKTDNTLHLAEGTGSLVPSLTTSPSAVTVGGQTCTNVTVLSDTSLTCTLPTAPATLACGTTTSEDLVVSVYDDTNTGQDATLKGAVSYTGAACLNGGGGNTAIPTLGKLALCLLALLMMAGGVAMGMRRSLVRR